jgi:transposase InsO family protein
VIFTAISSLNNGKNPISISRACSLFGVSRGGYYDWTSRDDVSPASSYEMDLKDEIQKIALKHLRYGYRRVKVELRRRGFQANGKLVLRLMREDNLLVVRRTFKPVTTDSNHGLEVFPNLARDMAVTGLNQLWVADITYIQLLQEFVYLAVI